MFKQIGKNYERETASLTVVGQNKLICKLQHSPYIKVIFNIQNKKRPQILIQQFSSAYLTVIICTFFSFHCFE